MPDIHIAEQILSLVTSRDRAASIAGDLAEVAAARGVMWFWSGVLRTAASLLWRDVAENFARVAGMAFVGLAVCIGLDLLFAALSGAAFVIAAFTTGSPLQLESLGWKLWFFAPVLLNSVVVGRILARRAPGRELAICVVYAVLISVYNLTPAFGDNGVFPALSCVLAVLAGAAWGRSRRLRATQPIPAR